MAKKARDLDELPDVYLICRMKTHDWEPEVTFREKKGRRVVDDAWWYCGREQRAGLEPNRQHVISSATTGKLISTNIVYTDGYLLESKKRGGGRGRYKPEARKNYYDRQAMNASHLKAV